MSDPGGSSGLVLDTSVWINLLATGAIEAVLAALAIPCHAPEQVVAELKRDPVTGDAFNPDRHPLRDMSSRVSILTLGAAERNLFLKIVGAPAADALGDGEAAAIAIAASRRMDIAIDDRKARRIIRERFPLLQVRWTVDLLRAPLVVAALGARQAEECFEKARRLGRMHVPRS